MSDGYGKCIYRRTADGAVSIFAGSTNREYASVDGTGTAARFMSPADMVLDEQDNLYVADFSP